MTREPWKITREMFLSLDEVDSLRAHVDGAILTAAGDARRSAIVDQVIVESLLFSGLRNSELCRLKLGEVDLGQKEPAFQVRGTPREDRTVYIPGFLAQLLRQYVADTRPDCLPAGASSRDKALPLIVNERGRAYERTALYRRVVRILAEAGLAERASVQLLRHTYGYLAYLRSGCNLLFVQRQLGHAHPMVTSVYAEFVEESYAEIADAIAGMKSPPFNTAKTKRKPVTSAPERN